MKKTLFIISILCLLALGAFAQTIRRVSSAGIAGVNVYGTLQAAHDAAVSGDIIYVEPTSVSFGDLIATKRLTIYGNGFFLAENPNPTIDTRLSLVGNITFKTGTANSLISGLSVGNLYVKDQNITITRCKINAYVQLNFDGTSGNPTSLADNTSILGCYFAGLQSSGDIIFGTNVSFPSPTPARLISGVIIKNNIFDANGPGIVNNIQNGLIMNNTVRSSWTTFNSGSTQGCVYTNNVCVGGDATKLNTTNGNSFNNNISLGSAFWPSGNNNQNSVSTVGFFIGAVPTFNAGPDNAYQLSATSVGLSAGVNGGQVGAFGGISPYLLGSIPPIPIITNITTSGVGNSSTPLSVSVTVRGNN